VKKSGAQGHNQGYDREDDQERGGSVSHGPQVW